MTQAALSNAPQLALDAQAGLTIDGHPDTIDLRTADGMDMAEQLLGEAFETELLPLLRVMGFRVEDGLAVPDDQFAAIGRNIKSNPASRAIDNK